jgi:hypothetical protein
MKWPASAVDEVNRRWSMLYDPLPLSLFRIENGR